MAASDVVGEAQCKVFNSVSQSLIRASGAEAIILGGTDLALVFNEKDTSFPLVDCTGIHADALEQLATSGTLAVKG
jgi:aspartate racemase